MRVSWLARILVAVGLAVGLGLAGAAALTHGGQDAQASASTSFTKKFPKNFLWGVSTSGFQSEGHFPDSNWTRYAQTAKQPYGNSVDFRHHYAQDITLAKNMGVKVFRTSIEWARVEPKKGERDATELKYYDDVVAKIRAAGMRPMLTLDHWVYPGWVADQGAWTNPDTEKEWLAEARFIVNRYKGKGVIWVTFNEASAYLTMEFAHRSMSLAQLMTMRDGLIAAHRSAYDMIHKLDPGALVSTNLSYGTALNPIFDQALFTKVKDKLDYIGIDYYYGASVGNLTAVLAAGSPWLVKPEPEGIYFVLQKYHKELPKLPLYIVENGMPTDNGNPRADKYTRTQHLRDHLYWVQRAINDGVPVIGYNYWSLTDNYEWGSYEPRFGLFTVNVNTDPALTRIPTDAVASYKALIANRGVPKGYVPVLKPVSCSVESCTAKPPATPAAP